jgi:ABC-2 type transport system ATP-binding protein
MKQRLSLARTLVHDPQVLILDEPASGLDPRARVEIRELLVELSRMGKTIFFSTHILSDVAEISTHVGIVEAGKLVASGPVEALQQHLLPGRTVEIALLEKVEEALEFIRNYPGVLSVVAGIKEGVRGKQLLRVEFMGDEKALGDLLSGIVSAGFPVVHFSAEKMDLEEVFMRATKGLVT